MIAYCDAGQRTTTFAGRKARIAALAMSESTLLTACQDDLLVPSQSLVRAPS